MDEPLDADAIASWIRDHDIRVLHIGGQREASSPGIYEAARRSLRDILGRAHAGPAPAR